MTLVLAVMGGGIIWILEMLLKRNKILAIHMFSKGVNNRHIAMDIITGKILIYCGKQDFEIFQAMSLNSRSCVTVYMSY